MDCKLGVRTFLVSEVQEKKKRTDLYKKLLKLAPEVITDEEHEEGALTKARYLMARDGISTTSSLGFRVEGIASNEEVEVRPEVLQRVSSEEDVIQKLMLVLPVKRSDGPEDMAQVRVKLVKDIIAELHAFRRAVEESPFVEKHELIGTSVLFVVDGEQARVHFIDLAKTTPLDDNVIDHRTPWTLDGKLHEDGVFIGVQSLCRCWEKVLSSLEKNEVVPMEKERERRMSALASTLEDHAVSPGTVSLEDLERQLNVHQTARLEANDGALCLVSDIVWAWIHTIRDGIDMALMDVSSGSPCPFIVMMGAGMQVKDTLHSEIASRFGFEEDFVIRHFRPVEGSYEFSRAAVADDLVQTHHSRKTLRVVTNIHKIDMNIIDPTIPQLAKIGLPEGTEFGIVAAENSFYGVKTTRWQWERVGDPVSYRNSFIDMFVEDDD